MALDINVKKKHFVRITVLQRDIRIKTLNEISVFFIKTFKPPYTNSEFNIFIYNYT